MLLNEALTDKFRQTLAIEEHQFSNLLEEAQYDAIQLAQLSITNKYASRDTVGMLLGDHYNCAYINLEQTLFDDKVVLQLSIELAKKYQAIPLYQFGDAITLVMAYPNNTRAQEAIKEKLGPVDFLFSLPDEIETAIEIYYQQEKDVVDVFAGFDLEILDRITDEQSSELTEVITISKSIIMLALKEGSSDIHIEPKENSCIIRFRIDGVLIKRFNLSKSLNRVLVSRFKVMANLNISEKRKPQDGRIAFITAIKKIDIRVSTLPTIHGETVVMRLLGSLFGNISLNIDNLNITPSILKPFKHSLYQPNGLILVTGPTGSGKSTTLYAALNHLDTPALKILTVEDPVEYEILNFTQSQVDVKAGRTFASILRAVLRQDPDIILVGEIRDTETACIAAEAALTGHIVLSTLHTNNALQAISRLTEMGVEPYVVAPVMVKFFCRDFKPLFLCFLPFQPVLYIQ